MTSVGLSIDNSSALGVTAASTPVTSTGTLALEWQGTSSEYVTADGGKVSIPSSDNITIGLYPMVLTLQI